jgi:hypothetical protein
MNLKQCKSFRKLIKSIYKNLPETSYIISKDKRSIILGNCQRKEYKELKKVWKDK